MSGKMAYLSQEEKQKIRNALKIKKSLDKEEDNHNLRASSPESEEVDFKNVIHPLSYYIHDREQMVEEMFSIIKGDKLRKMLPPLLKNYTLEEVKADCLVHLLGMSKKRILAIIEGRELHSSSDSESESSTSASEPEETPKSPNKVESRPTIDDDDLLDISISEKDIDSLMKDKPKTDNKAKKPRTRIRKKIKTEKDVSLFSIVISDDELDDKSSKKVKKTNREHASTKLDKILGTKEKGRKRRKSATRSKNTNGNTDDGDQKLDDSGAANLDKNDKGKTLLEILELEMRARAIRALLKNTNDVEEGSSVLSEAVKSTTDAAAKSDPKIVSAIAEAIDQSLSDKNTQQDDSDADDVEIIDDIDLCVLIDDDDDIDMETTSEVAAPQTNANKKSDPPEKEAEKPVAATSEKSIPSNADENEKDDPSKSKPEADSEKTKPSMDDEKRKPDLEKNKPSTTDSEKSKPVKASLEKRKPSNEDSEKQNLSGPETSKSLPNDSKKRKRLKDNSAKKKSLKDDSAKKKSLKDVSAKKKSLKDVSAKKKSLKDDSAKTKSLKDDSAKSKSLSDDSAKSKSLKDDSAKSKSLTDDSAKSPTDVSEKSATSNEDSAQNEPSEADSAKSKPLKDENSEQFESSIDLSIEEPESSAENSAEKCEPPKESDLETVIEKYDLTKDDTPEAVEESPDKLTWSERWAEKQNVKEVVKNSKICANIRKRMRFARMLKQKQSEESKQKADEIDIGNVEESSVAHYNLIKAHTLKSADNADENPKDAEEQSVADVGASQEAAEDDADITTADHTLTILESDPKTLIIDISDDEVMPDPASCDKS